MRPCSFFYNVTGEEAERLLRLYGNEGEFLARPSESQPQHYTLSIIRLSNITHVKIQNKNGVLDLFGGDEFSSLTELVEFYVKNPHHLQEKNGAIIGMSRPISIPLSEPAAQEARTPTAQRWFHNVTGEEARQILAREKLWTYLVRDSQTAPGKFVITVKSSEDNVVHIMIERRSDTGMFHVNGGDDFSSIGELLMHHRNNPMVVEESQLVVHLHHLFPSTSVPADSIDDRIRLLEMIDPQTKKSGFADEYDRVQQGEGDDQFFSKREGKREVNAHKNRFKNILPYDHTRVVLNDGSSKDSDYVNASYIRLPENLSFQSKNTPKYISTQGCLEHTIVDFWSMVWQEDSRVVVMTTRELERTKHLCARYWPEVKQSIEYGQFYVKNVEETLVKSRNGMESFHKRRFMISKNGSYQKEIFHLQAVFWPDFGCPEDPSEMFEFMEAVHTVYENAPPRQGPMIVHCSAGIGRTGTFIAIDILLDQIREKGDNCPVDVMRTLVALRQQRDLLVQNVQQYELIYRTISSYMRHRHWGSFDELSLHSPTPAQTTTVVPPVPRRGRVFVASPR